MSYVLPSYTLPSYTLPSYTLPSYVLPSRALHLIRDYSRPMTKPDWRKSKPIVTTYRLFLQVKNVKLNSETPIDNLYMNILYNISNTEWYYVYSYINYHGLSKYLERGDCNIHMTYTDGIKDAIQFNVKRIIYSMRKCY